MKKSWTETEATTTRRDNQNNWKQEYLDLTGNDAGPDVIGTTTIYTNRPAGFVEFDVTNAVRNWRNGNSNYGVLLRAVDEYTDGRSFHFASDEDLDDKKHAYINTRCMWRFALKIKLLIIIQLNY